MAEHGLTTAELDRARRDPVAFAELVLRRPLWPHQIEVVRSAARVKALCWGRRAGKTHVFGVVALHRMFAVPGTRVLMVSAGRTSVVRSHREIAAMARAVSGESIEDEQVMLLRLTNGSQLESVTQSLNAVRSADTDLLIVDEAAFVEQSVWEAAEPTIIARPGSQVLMASTPWRGPGHFYHDTWRSGMDKPSDQLRSWHLPSTASPLVDRVMLEAIRERQAPDAFEREYEAAWTAASGSYFESSEIDGAVVDGLLVDAEDQAAVAGCGWVSAGVDFGMRRDANALVVVGAWREPDGRGRTRYAVRFVEERFRLPYEAWIERLVALSGPGGFRVSSMVAEVSGVGAMPVAVLERRSWEVTGRQFVEPLSTTAQTKVDSFGFIRLLLQQGRLVLPQHPSLLQQLRALEVEISDSGNMRLSVPDRIGHDDVALALSFAVRPLMQGELVPVVDEVVSQDDVFPDLDDAFGYLSFGEDGW